MTTFDSHVLDVTISNISRAGCRIKAPVGKRLLAGELVTLALSDDEYSAGQIKWSDGSEAGVAFLCPARVGAALADRGKV